jgi:fructose-1,6-bisphosphatase
LPESWWDSFEEHRANAIRKVEEDREAIRDKMEQQRLKKEDEFLAKTRNLLDDSEFCRITTQRGMKAYSLEKFPELESVDDSRLTQEIQKLSDKAKARKRK